MNTLHEVPGHRLLYWISFACVILAGSSAALAQNDAWDPRFGSNGLSNIVRALAVASNGHVFAGGDFTTAAGVGALRVAEWDGASWSPLGSGVSDLVYALAVDSGNNVYVGGKFTTAGGGIAGRIAMWDGAGWQDLDGGMSGEVYALAVDGSGDVYAGGAFTVAGGITVGRIARWDGSSWQDLDGGVSGDVYALAVDGSGNVYAGGAFTVAGGSAALRVAKWDGVTWSPIGGGISNDVRALATGPGGDLYAGGIFTTAGGITAGRVAGWNGSAWYDLDGGVSGDVYALASNGVDLFAAGAFTVTGGGAALRVARWDGNNWSNFGDGLSANVLAVGASGNNVYVGGEFTTAGLKTSLYFARWNPDIVPVAIQEFEASAGEGRVDLSWRIFADEPVEGFRIYRREAGSGFKLMNTAALVPAGAQTYSDTRVSPGGVYQYQLAAVTSDGAERRSRIIEASVPWSSFVLEQNFPNPFNPITTIRFSGPAGVSVRVVVYDLNGAAVATLFDGVSPGGPHEMQWNGRNERGAPAATGVYFYRLQAGKRTITRKMLLLK